MDGSGGVVRGWDLDADIRMYTLKIKGAIPCNKLREWLQVTKYFSEDELIFY